jgi:hypothetical protein
MEDNRGAELTRLLMILLLSGCAGTTSHETRSLICLGFCTEQRMEHKATPKEKPNEANNQTP